MVVCIMYVFLCFITFRYSRFMSEVLIWDRLVALEIMCISVFDMLAVYVCNYVNTHMCVSSLS